MASVDEVFAGSAAGVGAVIAKAREAGAMMCVVVVGAAGDALSETYEATLTGDVVRPYLTALAADGSSGADLELPIVPLRFVMGTPECSQFTAIFPVLAPPTTFFINPGTMEALGFVVGAVDGDAFVDHARVAWAKMAGSQGASDNGSAATTATSATATAPADGGDSAATSSTAVPAGTGTGNDGSQDRPADADEEAALEAEEAEAASAGRPPSPTHPGEDAEARKKRKLQDLRDRIAAKRMEKAAAEAEEKREREKRRREEGKKMVLARAELDRKAKEAEAAKRRKEKDADATYRRELKARLKAEKEAKKREREAARAARAAAAAGGGSGTAPVATATAASSSPAAQAAASRFETTEGRTVLGRAPSVAPAADVSTDAPTTPRTPAAPDSGLTNLAFRLTNGDVLKATFRLSDTLIQAIEYIDAERTDGTMGYSMMTAYPRHVFEMDEYRASFEDLGLFPSATIILSPREDNYGNTAQMAAAEAAGGGWTDSIASAASYLNPFAWFGGGGNDTPPPAQAYTPPPTAATTAPTRRRGGAGGGGGGGGFATMAEMRSDDAVPSDNNGTWNGNSTQQY